MDVDTDGRETERLEQRLRVVLRDPGHAVAPDAVPLGAVHAGAVRRRRRRAAGIAAAGAAVLAAVAVPVGIALAPGPSPSRVTAVGSNTASGLASAAPTTAASTSPTPTASQPSVSATTAAPAGAVLPWAGARVASVTATSTRRIVVLGLLGETGRCLPPGCLRLAASDDGGVTYRPLGAPATARTAGRNGATEVRFGSASDGWVFGPALWSTHDAGAHWARQRLGGQVRHLAAARGHVWALVSAPGDTEQLWTSAAGTDSWHPVTHVSVDAPGDVTTIGSRVVVVGIGTSAAWVGDPAGFAAHPGPCRDALAAELSGSATLWATCVTGTAAFVATSPDGAGWTTVPVSRAGSLPNSVQVGARGADALLAVPAEPVARVSSDGSTAALATPPPAGEDVGYIGFTSADVGLAVVGGRLYRTADGGSTWSLATPA